MHSFIVAIIDDEITNYLTLKAFLSRLPVNVSMINFSDGKEAYDFLVKNASNQVMLPDYIFLDIEMPRMGGWEFLDKFEEMQDDLSKKINIIINSGSGRDQESLINYPFVKGYLKKPITAFPMLNNIMSDIVAALEFDLNDSEDVWFFVDPHYHIIYFNTKAASNSKKFHNKVLRSGDSILDFARDTQNKIDGDFIKYFGEAAKGSKIVREQEVIYKEARIFIRTTFTPVNKNGILQGLSILVKELPIAI